MRQAFGRNRLVAHSPITRQIIYALNVFRKQLCLFGANRDSKS